MTVSVYMMTFLVPQEVQAKFTQQSGDPCKSLRPRPEGHCCFVLLCCKTVLLAQTHVDQASLRPLILLHQVHQGQPGLHEAGIMEVRWMLI